MKIKLPVVMSLLLLSGCSLLLGTGRECPPEAMIEWIEAVKINDIQFAALDADNYQVQQEDLGSVLGEVSYKMADKACTDHQMRNGDAAYLEVGTVIQEFKGYDADFRVIADGKVFQVSENDQAKTIGELYDIEGKITGMSVRSSYDGSFVMDLKEEHWQEFTEEFLALEYVGFDEIYKEIESEEGTFLDFHLADGSSVRINYWTEANVLNPGAHGTERMLEIISLYK